MEDRCRRSVPRAQSKGEAALKAGWFAIVNPNSGGNRNRDRFAELMSALGRLAAKTALTLHPGHAAELARDARSFAGIVAVGGDGTLFEILKGMDFKRQRIALVPAGRGNSLARDLGLLNGHGSLDVMHWQQTRNIDLMQVDVTTTDGAHSIHYSASTAAVGYPASVTLEARKLARLGSLSYAAAAAVTRPSHFRARVQYGDGAPREVRLSGFVANNTRHMANFVAFRKASYCDGRFEVMEMDAGRVKQTAHNLSALSRTGVYEPHPIHQATSARLELDAPQDVMMDGEIVPGAISIQVNVLPSALACTQPGAA